jgi:cytochrome c-type biogenesis protein CcmE
MKSLSRKLWIAGLVVATAIGYLAYAGAKQGLVYYVPVDQFIRDQQQQKHRVRLMGKVAAQDCVIDRAAMRARFALEANGARLPVQYAGAIPDLFKADTDVVVEGKMNSSGTFEADVLLTKCASKYDPKHPGTEKRS